MNHRPSRAFALRDLVVSVAVLFVCSLLALSAIGNDRTHAQAFVCLSNLRQLGNAWQLYAAENNDVFVENYAGGEANLGAIANRRGAAPWAVGWLDWTAAPDNTNYTFLRTTKYARLAPYFEADRNIHKCPADTYVAAAQIAKGMRSRVRSVALNASFGAGNQEAGPTDPSYLKIRSYQALGSLEAPPAQFFTFLDEHPDSIDDPVYWPAHLKAWSDLPASFHNAAGSFVFADGHFEQHSWLGSARRAPIVIGRAFPQPLPNDPDLAWIRSHSPLRPIQ